MSNVLTTQEIVIVENEKALTTSLHIADGANQRSRTFDATMFI